MDNNTNGFNYKRNSQNGTYIILITMIIVTVMVISFVIGLLKFNDSATSDVSDTDESVSNDESKSDASSNDSNVSSEQYVPESKHPYYDDLQLVEITVSNSTVADGTLSVVTKDNAVFPNVDQSELKSFYSKTNQHNVYGLSGVNLHVYEEALNNFDKFIIDCYGSISDCSMIVDKAYVTPEGTFGGNIVSGIDFSSTDVDLISGYSVRFARCPDGDNYRFLTEQAYKYGIIQRYPANRENYTGFSENRQIYRYVGVTHSEYMSYYNFSLEEYIDKLRTEKIIEFKSDSQTGKVFILYYIPVNMNSTETSIKVPVEGSYEYTISGDGSRGFVVSVVVSE